MLRRWIKTRMRFTGLRSTWKTTSYSWTLRSTDHTWCWNTLATSHCCTRMSELNVVKQTQKHFTYLFKSKRKLTMRTFLYQNSGWLQLINTIKTKKSIALCALVWFCWYLITYYTIEDVRIYVYLILMRLF